MRWIGRSILCLLPLAAVGAFVFGFGAVHQDPLEVGESGLFQIEEGDLIYTFNPLFGSEALFDRRQDAGFLVNLMPSRSEDGLRLRRALERKLGVDNLDELRRSRQGEIEVLKSLGYL